MNDIAINDVARQDGDWLLALPPHQQGERVGADQATAVPERGLQIPLVTAQGPIQTGAPHGVLRRGAPRVQGR
jgi:hypothetical protein